MRTGVLWVVAAFLGCALARSAAAETPPVDRADVLFREGLSLFDAQQYAQACLKLAESVRLETATGSLLALAACHEAQGKTASAWFEYGAVIERSRSEGREDRVQAARQHRAALEPRLARLIIGISPEVRGTLGVVVMRDGTAVKADSWGTCVPVDPGEHSVEASAPGRQSWSTTVTLTGDGASASVTVPPLAEVAGDAWSHSEGGARLPASLRASGVATGVAGIVALGIAGYFTGQAIHRNDDSQSDCIGNQCGPTGRQDRLSAIASARAATAATVIGGVLVAGGVALFVVGAAHETGPTLAAAPAIDPRGAHLVLGATF